MLFTVNIKKTCYKGLTIWHGEKGNQGHKEKKAPDCHCKAENTGQPMVADSM